MGGWVNTKSKAKHLQTERDVTIPTMDGVCATQTGSHCGLLPTPTSSHHSPRWMGSMKLRLATHNPLLGPVFLGSFSSPPSRPPSTNSQHLCHDTYNFLLFFILFITCTFTVGHMTDALYFCTWLTTSLYLDWWLTTPSTQLTQY